MAFDGIITRAVVKELSDTITLGKIEKIYQPEADELVFHIHTKKGNVKLYACAGSAAPRLHLTSESLPNPPSPLAFCMLLRKHLTAGRIVKVEQKDAERIVEISLETLNELGFTLSRKLIFEIMGKHSNIILVDVASGKIIDSIKRVSIDVNRVRQVLPGKVYEYPPSQDKTPFDQTTERLFLSLPKTGKAYLSAIGGISPAIADELAQNAAPQDFLDRLACAIDQGVFTPHLYADEKGVPQEFHIADLSAYETGATRMDFPTLSECLNYFYQHRTSTNRIRQRSQQLHKTISALLDKLYLKKQRLSEDLLKAENSEDLRLCGELLTANMHLIKPGANTVQVTNYYDGSLMDIALDPRYTPAKNAQQYFKRYGKSKTAVKEKQIQLEETQSDIDYLESVLTYLSQTNSAEEVEALKAELADCGFIRRKKEKFKEKKYKAQPYRYTTSDGFSVFVGRNNRENDILTLKTAAKTDIWMHTKDIPGSHLIVKTEGGEISETAIFEAAAIAAYHSKGRDSENVPVDYVPVRYVKKPQGAKPGMVIFTNNKTVWVNPTLPQEDPKDPSSKSPADFGR